MEPSAQDVSIAVAKEAGDEQDEAVRNVKHCLKQLNEEQVWWRPAASMNSIANLILHVCGDVRQWITSGIGRAEDTPNRPTEFSEQGAFAKAKLPRRLDLALAEALTFVVTRKRLST